MAGDYVLSHPIEPRPPILSFPAVRRVGVDLETRVGTTDAHQMEKVLGADSGGARVNLVGEIDAELASVFPYSLRFDHETFLAFFDEVVAGAAPEAPGIAGGNFPAKSRAPEHRDDSDAEFGAEIEQVENVILSPLLDFPRRLLSHLGRNKGPDGRAVGPGSGVDPERTVGADAVELELVSLVHVPDFRGRKESAPFGLQHEIRGLSTRCARIPGKLQESQEPLRTVLGALYAAVKHFLPHVRSPSV